MITRWAYTLLPVYLLLSAPVGPVQKARIEVISSVEELTEAFDASASSHDGVLVFTPASEREVAIIWKISRLHVESLAGAGER